MIRGKIFCSYIIGADRELLYFSLSNDVGGITTGKSGRGQDFQEVSVGHFFPIEHDKILFASRQNPADDNGIRLEGEKNREIDSDASQRKINIEPDLESADWCCPE